METRGFEIRRTSDDNRLRVSGMPVVFGSLSEDLGGFRERFASGALTKTLSERQDVGLLYSHDTGAVLASREAGNLRLDVDDAALTMSADLDLADPDVQRLAAKLEAGTVRSMSFGFRTVRDRWDDEDEDGMPIRTVTEAQLLEVSAVWLPAYPATSIVGRTSIGDIPVGVLASMPADLRERMLVEVRDGQLDRATQATVDRAIEALRSLLPDDEPPAEAEPATSRLAAARRLALAEHI